MDSRRILLLSHEMTLSGAPLALFYLGSWLKRKGWEPVVAAPEHGPISDLLENSGVRVEIDPTLLTDPQREILRALCRESDIVVANTITSWPAVEAGHRENVPVIWYLHETLVAVRFIKQISQVRDALELARLIVVPTRQAGRVLKGATRTRIEVVPYGIPEPPNVTPRANDQAVSFVALGSFELRKGQDILVEAIHQVDRVTSDKASFKLAGRILDRQFFENVRDRSANLKNVELVESLDHEEAFRLLASSSAIICASRDETMPISIIEAASLGKAVISTDVGGISEWIHDELNGLLVPPENPARLTDAIVRCARDSSFVRQLGVAARRTFEHHFTIDRFAARFAALLEEARQPKVTPPVSAQSNYERWVAAFDNASPTDRINLRRRIRRLQRQPVIAVLLPVYNPDLGLLEAAIDSIKGQIYGRWELCIADDASTIREVHPFLERIARADSRIKLILRKENRHISACSNSALALATGEWCALLDQDDVFAENALAFVALEIMAHVDAGLIYSDEDKIDNHGARSNPFFKTDWNPQLFLGQNYINHLGVYRTSLLREIGGFREGYEGSQDYDLALRCVEKLRPDQVRHIPRILYHWRMAEGSLAAVPDAKPYAKEAARRAIADHLKQRGVKARVVPCPENPESHRVVYEVPDPAPLVSIIIPTRDNAALLERCIKSIRERTDYPRVEIIIVDNGSTETKTLEFLRALKEEKIARVLRDAGPFNFSRLSNRGEAEATGAILTFMNDDVEADERGWLKEMVSQVVRLEVGAVGARLWYPNGTLQHGGVILGLGGIAGVAYHTIPRGHPGYFNRAWLQQNYSAVTAACLLVRKSVFEEAGRFDEVNLGISFNDVDFCLALRRRGLQIVWTPYANLIHRESSSRGHPSTPAHQQQFFREATHMQQKWGGELLCDPFYSPNFSLHWPGFDFACPPRWKNGTAVESTTGANDVAPAYPSSWPVFIS
jgi:glycosyltransferase involved in cell wall biosynthesis